MRVIEAVIAGYRKKATPIADICLATAAATATLAGITFLADCFATSWGVSTGLLWVAGFYLVLGLAALTRNANRLESDSPADMASDREAWSENMISIVPKFFFNSRTIRRLRHRRSRDWIADRGRMPSTDANERNSPQS